MIETEFPRAHPILLLTAEKTADLRSVEEVRSSLYSGRVKVIWERILKQVESDLVTPPYTEKTMVPGRLLQQAEAGNRDYVIVQAAAARITRAGLTSLLTGDARFSREALRQLECVYDENVWPDWRDMSHLHTVADLRTGQFMRAIGLAYDWLYPTLSPDERRWRGNCRNGPWRRSSLEPVSH